MLRIRLQRTGMKNTPSYRIVVTEKANPAKSKSLEVLGHYLPSRDPAVFECKTDRVAHWVSLGAIPTDTMARILAKNGVKGMEKYMQRYAKKRNKKAPPEEVAKPEAPAPAAAPEAAAPVVEAEAPKEGGDTAQ